MKTRFRIIIPGMGVGISSLDFTRYLLSLNLSELLPTLSMVLVERLFVYELQQGDPTGDFRRALTTFPFPKPAKLVLDTFFVERGIGKKETVEMFTVDPSDLLNSLNICASYSYVYLAKEKSPNPISINYLTKLAMSQIGSLVGAILAGADFVTMGAGIPINIPQLMDSICKWENCSYPVPVVGKDGKNWNYSMNFDPRIFLGEKPYELKKPGLIPIVSSNLLATMIKIKFPPGSVFGIYIERTNSDGAPNSGGHNAGPRDKIAYGERDLIDYEKIAELDLPFWIGGGMASPEMLDWVMSIGGEGVGAGTMASLSNQSGMDPEISKKVRRLGFNHKLKVRTDMRFSPAGFPFKIDELEGTMSEEDVLKKMVRVCDQGGLRIPYETPSGDIDYRCPAEPVSSYLRKGGCIEDTVGKGCLCNGLFRTCDKLCKKSRNKWPAAVTSGDDYSFLNKVMDHENDSYDMAKGLNYLLRR